MTIQKPQIQCPALRLLNAGDVGAEEGHARLAQDLRAKLGREGALRACRANGWTGTLGVLFSKKVSEGAAA